MRHFKAIAELHPEGAGTGLVFRSEIECVGVLGLLARLSGQIGREGDKRVAAIKKMIRQADAPGHIAGASAAEAAKPAARRRLAALIV